MNCPECGLTNIVTQTVTESFPHGETEHAFEATFPTMTCSDCQFGWRDFRAEQAIDEAMAEYQADGQTAEDRIAEFLSLVRDFLAEHLKDDNKEAFREALLLLAAEL